MYKLYPLRCTKCKITVVTGTLFPPEISSHHSERKVKVHFMYERQERTELKIGSYLSATVLILLRSYNIAMVRKGRPGPNGKGEARKSCAQKPLTKPTNQDAGLESEGESASIARASETPEIVMQN